VHFLISAAELFSKYPLLHIRNIMQPQPSLFILSNIKAGQMRKMSINAENVFENHANTGGKEKNTD
jgi:hypothetical protein